MIGEAEAAEEGYTSGAEGAAEDESGNDTGLGDDMDGYRIRTDVADTLEGLVMPRFVTREDAGLFSLLEYDGEVPFERRMLLEDFNLAKCGTEGISFDATGYDPARMIDADEHGVYKSRYLDEKRIAEFRKVLSSSSPEGKRQAVASGIYDRMTPKFKSTYGERGLTGYIKRLVTQMDNDQIDAYLDNVGRYARTIASAIGSKAGRYCRRRFTEQLDSGKVYLREIYRFPTVFHTGSPLEQYDRTLYEAEDSGMNKLERSMAEALANCNGVRWWHRIVERRENEFCINGFINHYPDFVAMTRSGRIYVIETKGDDRQNPDSVYKLELGRKWADLAGQMYHYFMVFEDDPLDMAGAYSFANFKAKILNQL